MWQRQDYQDGNQRALSFTMHLYFIQSRAFLCEFWEFAVKMKMLIDACKVAVCWSLGANVQYTVNYSFILKSVLKWQNKSKPMKIKYYLDNNLFYLFIYLISLTHWHVGFPSCTLANLNLPLSCDATSVFSTMHNAVTLIFSSRAYTAAWGEEVNFWQYQSEGFIAVRIRRGFARLF